MRWATPDDAHIHAELLGGEPSLSLAGRLSKDDRCYLVLEGGRALHATWCSTTATWTEELQTYLAPPPGDAYIYESFTGPGARGRGIYPMALRSISALLHAERVRRLWIGVEDTNLASIRAIRKGGFQDAFAITFVRTPSGPNHEIDRALDPLESLHIPRNGHQITRKGDRQG